MSTKGTTQASSGFGEEKVEKYLTQMKELPTDSKKDLSAKKKVAKTSVKPQAKMGTQPVAMDPVQARKESWLSELPLSSKDIILGTVNLITVVALFFLLVKLPEKAETLNKLTIENIRNESSVSFEFSDVEASKEKADKLTELFIDESGVVDFVAEVEDIKAESGSIQKLTFTGEGATKDKTGNYGIPVIIEMRGTWEEIGKDLEKIQTLNYLFRAVKIEARNVLLEDEETKELIDTNVVELEYGGFLYVSDKLGKS
jgi:hypothetical protein